MSAKYDKCFIQKEKQNKTNKKQKKQKISMAYECQI